jgi:hypothetical protein
MVPEQSTTQFERSSKMTVIFETRSAQNEALVRATLECDCEPYEDVFTYKMWQEQGYQVRKGEKAAVRVPTYHETKEVDADGNEKIRTYRKTACLFCRCQVDEIG